MEEIFIPTLLTMQNANTFFGSFHSLRFCLTPLTDEKEIRAEYWHGKFCYESSRIDGEETFPLTEDGLAEVGRWLIRLAKYAEKPEQTSES